MLPAVEALDLGARRVELALELAVAVAQRREVVVELPQGQTKLGERELVVLAPEAAAEPLVAEQGSLISIRRAHDCSLFVRLARHRSWPAE